MFKRTLYSDLITINRPKDLVWEVLVDLDNYPKWNPFTNPVISTLKMGSPVELHVKMPIRGDRIQTEILICNDIEETLSWGMTLGHSSLLIAQRDQKVEAINGDQCSYQTWDAFHGLLTPMVVGLFGKDMLNGFNGVANSLKEYCENL